MSPASPMRVNVVEINPYAPRPFTFTEAALCLRDAIRAAGHPSDILINGTDPDQACIILGALPPHTERIEQELDPRRTIIFNLEQLGSDSPLAGPDHRRWLGRWLVADYHSRNIALLKAESGGRQQAMLLPLVPGASVLFRHDLPFEKCVDVLFFGTPCPRRERILDGLRAAGLSVDVVAGAFGEELTPAIRRARVVLHVHYYETGYFPAVRMLQPVVNCVPVVCEDSVFSDGPDWARSGIVFAPYEDLVAQCVRLARSPDEQAERGQRTLEFARRIDFATPLAALLEALQAMPAGPPREAPAASAVPPDEGPLSVEEIESILARENAALPPESHLQAPAFKLAERQPGQAQGWQGLWLTALFVLFGLYGLWMMLR